MDIHGRGVPVTFFPFSFDKAMSQRQSQQQQQDQQSGSK
jgi:hypothetical protein